MAAVKESSPVLIVEDDRKTASLVALYLEREGFKTISAYDGQKALELATRHQPGFVILDLMLPKIALHIFLNKRRSLNIITCMKTI